MSKIAMHVYHCAECELIFAASQEYEDQDAIQCPVCQKDDDVSVIGAGQLEVQLYG